MTNQNLVFSLLHSERTRCDSPFEKISNYDLKGQSPNQWTGVSFKKRPGKKHCGKGNFFYQIHCTPRGGTKCPDLKSISLGIIGLTLFTFYNSLRYCNTSSSDTPIHPLIQTHPPRGLFFIAHFSRHVRWQNYKLIKTFPGSWESYPVLRTHCHKWCPYYWVTHPGSWDC